MEANQSMTAQQMPFSKAMTTKTYKTLIANTLSDPGRAARFSAAITSAVAINPALQQCEAGTILAGALLGETMNLSPSPQLGQYYLVPFKQKAKYDRQGQLISPEVTNAQFVMGYKGYVQLALRSGQYADMDVMEIREGEYLGRDGATGKHKFSFIEDDDERETVSVIGYMAYFEYINGFRKTLYWSKKKVLNHADKYSPAFSAADYQKLQNGEIPKNELWKYSSFWYKDFDDMAKKTLLRQLISKWGVMSIEMQTAFIHDGSIQAVSGNGEITVTPEQNLGLEAPEPVSAPAEINMEDL